MKLSFLGNNSDKTRLSGHSVLGLYTHFHISLLAVGVGGGVGEGDKEGREEKAEKRWRVRNSWCICQDSVQRAQGAELDQSWKPAGPGATSRHHGSLR